MADRPLDRLFSPRGVALIGASERPGSYGLVLAQRLLAGHGPQTFLVNRKAQQILGAPCLNEVSELESGLDLAIIATRWDGVPDVIDDLIDRQCGAAIVVAARPDNQWSLSSRAQAMQRLAKRATQGGMRLIGPESAGMVLPHCGLDLSLGIGLAPAGEIAALADSGAPLSVLSEWARRHELGMHSLLALGDAADVDIADCIDHHAQDGHCRTVLLHLGRTVPDRKLLSAIRGCALRKPVVALCHWGRELSADQASAYRRALYRAGAMAVNRLRDLAAAMHFARPSWPHAGNRFFVLGNSTALLQIADQAIDEFDAQRATLSPSAQTSISELLGGDTALRNPLELPRQFKASSYPEVASILLQTDHIDAVLLVYHETRVAVDADTLIAGVRALLQGRTTLLVSLTGTAQEPLRRALSQAGVACFGNPEEAVQAYMLNHQYFTQRRALSATVHGLPFDDFRVRRDLRALRARAHTDPDLPGLLLQTVGFRLTQLQPNQADDALGIVGLLRADPIGLCLYAETTGSPAFEPLAVTAREVDRLLDACTLSAAEPWLRPRLAELLYGLGLIGLEFPELERIDVMTFAAEQCALRLRFTDDAQLCAFAPPPLSPDHLRVATDGTTLRVRSIRAEDEPRLQEGFTRLSPEEVRMRFMYPLKALTHELAARLTQIDYDREIAVVLCSDAAPGDAELYGVARASLDFARNSAEFAIVIPRQLSGEGLGSHLLELLMQEARKRGVDLFFGDVLPENQAMLGLARKLGMRQVPQDGERGVIRVQTRLTDGS